MPPKLATITVLLAGLPTGTGSFMLAELYGRRAVVTSYTVLLSTIGALVTLSLYLYATGYVTN